MTLNVQHRLLRQLAEQEILDTYDGWPAIRARMTDSQTTRVRALRWQVAAAALIALILGGTALLATSNPQSVSAESLLDRAGAVSDGLAGTARSYHITATTMLRQGDHVVPFAAPAVQQEETWFDGHGRMRQETRTAEWSTVTMTDGTQTWWAITRGSQTYAAPANGIRFSDTARLNPLATPGSNIASVLTAVSQRGCGAAELGPEQNVVGRSAYLILVRHTLKESCGDTLQSIAAPGPSPEPQLDPSTAARIRADKAAAEKAAADKSGPNKAPGGVAAQASPEPVLSLGSKPDDPAARVELERMLSNIVVDRFWIDKDTFVPLKVEQNYGPKGTITYQVTSVAYDVTLSDSLFQYVPPSGAQVLSGPAEIKKTLAK